MSQANERTISNKIVSEPAAEPGVITSPGPTTGPLTNRLARSVLAWGQHELSTWRAIFRGPAPFALLLATLLLLAIAWQNPFAYTVDSSTDLNLDQPFLQNFNDIENSLPKYQGEWYRWSRGEGRLVFPGAGRRDYQLQLNMAAGPNPNQSFTILAGEQQIASGKLEPGQKTYVYNLPAGAITSRTGDISLTIRTTAFTPKGDRRELGFVFYSARIDPQPAGLIVPPPAYLGLLVGLVMLAYALLARAGFRAWRAVGGAGFGALLLGYGIFNPASRAWLVLGALPLAFAFGWAIFMMVLLSAPLRRVWSNGWETRWTLAIFGLALAVRLGGLLHPFAFHGPNEVDIGFHVHRMAAFWDGHLWWDKIVSTEWGSRPTYYPMTVYFLAGLFQWWIPDRFLLLQVWMNTFEASRVLLVFYLVKRVTGDGRSAVLAAFFMAALPVNMLSLAWGQVANLFAEWLVLVSLCLAVVKWQQLCQPVYFGLLTFTLFASFIVHPGEVVLAGLVFVVFGGIMWLKQGGQQAKFFLAAYFLAILLAVASYHWITVRDMLPEALKSLQGTATTESSGSSSVRFHTGGSVEDPRLGFTFRYGVKSLPEIVLEGVKGFGREARIYFDLFPVLMLPWALWWLWRSGQSGEIYDPLKQRLRWAGVIWLVTGIIFALVGMFLNLYVRYSLFMLPFIAIGAGLFLGRLWQRQAQQNRGWTALALIFALASWVALGTLSTFYDRLIYYLHGA